MDETNLILILNGPPGCGKDVGAAFLEKELNMQHLRFKTQLYAIALTIAGLPGGYECLFTDRELKESVISSPFVIAGKKVSPRQWLIHVSETVVKPLLGTSFFGKALAAEVLSNHSGKNIVVSDGGFTEELLSLTVKCPKHRIVVARVHRPGTSFEGDSRSWLSYEAEGRIKYVDVHNSGSTTEYFNKLVGVVTNVANN
jgi:hypothetical protein